MNREKILGWAVPALVVLVVGAVGGLGYLALAQPDRPGGSAQVVSPEPSRSDAVPGPSLPGASVGVGAGGTVGPGGPASVADAAPDGPENAPASATAGPDSPAIAEEVAGGGSSPAGNPAGGSATGAPPAPQPPGAVDCETTQCVALTFDDGPDRHTDAILDVLAAKGVRATFFVQGYRVDMFPDQLRREAAEGHEIDNHTWNHKNLTTLSARAIKLQIAKTNKAVEAVVGTKPGLVRPPYGAIDSKVTENAGLPLVMWSVDTRDWETKNVKKILRHIKRDTEPGAIILMHDTLAVTGKALGRAIDILREKGYTLVTVSELLGPDLAAGALYTQR